MSEGHRDSDSATSLSLLARLHGPSRDAEAWHKFVEVYGRLVYGWCRKAGVAPGDVNDLGQEVFRRVASSIDSFRHRQTKGSFRGWLKTITHHVMCDHFQQSSRRPNVEGGTENLTRLSSLPDTIEDEYEDGDEQEAESLGILHRALKLIEDDFEPHTWTAFWRTAMEGHDTADVAGDLGMNSRAVRQARYRVMARLRAEFAELIDP